MKTTILIAMGVSMITSSAVSGHGAHEHGVAQLQIAVEGTKVSLVLESPSETIYGFEHEAKTPAEKKAMNEALDALRNEMSLFVLFDPALQCQMKNTKLEVVSEGHHGGHRDVHAEWQADCKQSPSKSSVQIQFSKKFSRLSLLKVDLLSDQKQTHHDLKRGEGRIAL